jgi:hypothetical protein
MQLVDIKALKNERLSPQSAAIEVNVAGSNDLSNVTPIQTRKVQPLDVDGVLARSLPNLGAYSAPDVKKIVLS